MLAMICMVVLLTSCKRNATNAGNNNTTLSGTTDSTNDLTIYNYSHPYLENGARFEKVDSYDSAIFYYEEALKKFEQDKNWKGFAWTANQISNLFINVEGNDYTKALPFMQKALQVGKLHLGEMHPYTGLTYFFLGLYYYKLFDAGNALTNLQKALEIRIHYFGEQSIYVANTYNAIGDVHAYAYYSIIDAEKNYEKSLQIKETILPADDPSFVSSYYNFSTVADARGDYEKAIAYCYKALDKVAFLKHNQTLWTEFIYGSMAQSYAKAGDYVKAIDKLQQAIAINTTNNGSSDYLVFYYNNLGNIYNKQSDYTKAIESYNRSLALLQQKQSSEAVQLSETHLHLGFAYQHRNQPEHALPYFKKALTESIRFYGRSHEQTTIVYHAIANLHASRFQIDSALSNYQKALSSAFALDAQDIYTIPAITDFSRARFLFELIADKAEVLKQLYLNDKKSKNIKALNAALEYYDLADTLISLNSITLERENSKLNFIENNYHVYENALDCTFQLYQLTGDIQFTKKAFRYIDKWKAAILLESLAKEEANEQMDVAFSTELQALQTNFNYIQARLETENTSGHPDDQLLKLLHGRLLDIEKKEKHLRNSHIEKPQKNDAQPHSLTELMTYSREANCLVINYFWGDSAIYAVGVHGDSAIYLKTKQSALLNHCLTTYQNQLFNGYNISSEHEDYSAFTKSAVTIYEFLLQDLIRKFGVSAGARIIIIPDGLLSHIAFESLIDQPADGRHTNYKSLSYLINKYSISYAYSAQFLLKDPNTPKTVKDSDVLALGYSSKVSTTTARRSFRDTTLEELPGTAKELEAIANLMKGDYYSGDEATEQRFKADARNHTILHLALHGQSDPERSFNSRLVFKSQQDRVEDGSLYPYELYPLNLNARLAVLTACESGTGKSYRGEGIYSLARGFIYAGCPSVIMSLWRTDDQSTASIVEGFYRELSAGATIHNSLQTSKINFIRASNSRNAHPSNWAPLICLGETDTTIVTRRMNYWTLSVLVLTVIFLITTVILTLRNKRTHITGTDGTSP
jgi:CHAT domain-containing protein/tetratricopeptide (TPR) repeat protein